LLILEVEELELELDADFGTRSREPFDGEFGFEVGFET
jgi:hypothetical protein